MEKENLRIGIDIGGTNTVWGMIDSQDNYLFENSILTHAEEGVDNFVRKLAEKIQVDYKKFSDKYEIEGIGIAAPSVNHITGIIERAVNLRWGEVDFINKMKKYFDTQIVILNDANAAALGERFFGTAKGMNNFIVITLGTGLGIGIVVNGQLLYGENGLAGEIGHSIIEVNGRKCSCGKLGCLETYISATGLKRTVFNFLSYYDDASELRDISYNTMTSKRISELAQKNDKIAIKAYEYTGDVLARSLANLVTLFNPEAIILFGGLADSGDLLLKPVEHYLDKYLLDLYKGKIKILKSELQNGKAAILGACSFVKEVMEKNKAQLSYTELK
jgi:glucokinase